MSKYNLGIVLGGGGARGFAHLGIMQALSEQKIYPDIISGVSAGSIAGVFLADGKTPHQTLEILKAKGLFTYSKITIPKTGLLRLDGLEHELHNDISVDRMEDLKTPLIAAVVNLNRGHVEYLSSGPVEKVILASSSIPVLFAPVEMNGELYADGGLFDNVPAEPLRKICKNIIAVDISPVQSIEKLDSLIQIATRTLQLSMNATTKGLEEKCDLIIAPKKCSEYEILKASHADELFEVGYEYTMQSDIQVKLENLLTKD